MARTPTVIMPANWPQAPGPGACTLPLADGRELLVLQVQGRAFMPGKCSCPFAAVDAVLAVHGRQGQQASRKHVTLLDIHAETSSEKQALAWHVAGRVTAAVGTHTHVPTADARILAGTTAFQTDLGMCGAYDSVIGFEAQAAIERFVGKDKQSLPVAAARDVRICGAVIDVASDADAAISIQSVQWPAPTPHAPLPPLI